MVGPGMLDGLFTGLVMFGVIIVASIWGCWELIDLFFIDDAIRTSTPIIPELELIVKDNIVDTVFVYRK
jgi:hypothetical protein